MLSREMEGTHPRKRIGNEVMEVFIREVLYLRSCTMVWKASLDMSAIL